MNIFAAKVGLVSVLLASGSAFAASTVTFQGEVSSQTCTMSINSTTNATVLMATQPLSSLYTASTTNVAVGNSSGLTPFTINISGCSTSTTGATTLYPEFLGTSVDTTTYALGNTASSNAATGVGVALYSDATGTTQIQLNGVTKGAALTVPAGTATASTTYSAKYMATTTSPTAGKVVGVAQYTLTYF